MVDVEIKYKKIEFDAAVGKLQSQFFSPVCKIEFCKTSGMNFNYLGL
jgi:hypothetical protein